jgi:hypothetical protein
MNKEQAIKKLNAMIEGCIHVYKDRDMNREAQDLARMVREDCDELLKIINVE